MLLRKVQLRLLDTSLSFLMQDNSEIAYLRTASFFWKVAMTRCHVLHDKIFQAPERLEMRLVLLANSWECIQWKYVAPSLAVSQYCHYYKASDTWSQFMMIMSG